MIREDVKAQERELCEEVGDYIHHHEAAIKAKLAQIDYEGPIGAAGVEAQLGNARLATVSESLFLEGTTAPMTRRRSISSNEAFARPGRFAASSTPIAWLWGPVF